jgi:hypothetical protein
MFRCQVCTSKTVKILLDFGFKPLCNRFVKHSKHEEYTHPLVLGQCIDCGLVQITNPVPSDEITPRVEWLEYNEPEGHLDNLAEFLCNLDGLPEDPVACGISYKDDSLLKRLKENIFSDTWRIDPIDFDITRKGIAGETIIPKITQTSVDKLVSKYGRVNLIIARHVLEHALDTQLFIDSIKDLLEPGAYVVFEVPDCTLQIQECDFTMLWEEHILYFTPYTLKNSFKNTCFNLLHYKSYPYPVENALVAIVQKNNKELKQLNYDALLANQQQVNANNYASSFLNSRELLKRYIVNYSNSSGRIAVFGAGHISVMFINLMEIKDSIEFVVDDDSNKQGFYIPGTNIPIKPSNFLVTKGIKLCLLGLSPESEKKVINSNNEFTSKGGKFLSIFPNRRNSIQAIV